MGRSMDNTIVVFTTDKRHRGLHLAPMAEQTPFAPEQGHDHGRRLPRAGDDPPGQAKVPAGKVRERASISGLGLVSDFSLRAAGNPEHRRRAEEGANRSADTTYKCYLDGYNQMDMITGKGPSKPARKSGTSAKSELGGCAHRTTTSIVSSISLEAGSVKKTKPDVPYSDQPSPRSFRAHRLAQ